MSVRWTELENAEILYGRSHALGGTREGTEGPGGREGGGGSQ